MDGQPAIDRGLGKQPVFAKKPKPAVKKQDVVRYKTIDGYITRVPKHNQQLNKINKKETVIVQQDYPDYQFTVQIVEYINIFGHLNYKVQTVDRERHETIVKGKDLSAPQAKGMYYRLNKSIASGWWNLNPGEYE